MSDTRPNGPKSTRLVERFRAEREAAWQRLDTMLTTIEKGKESQLPDDDLIALPGLYRHAISSLSVTRARFLDNGLRDYLESLCRRAYFLVYGIDEAIGDRIKDFFQRGWNAAVRDLLPEFAVAASLMFLGFIAAWAMVARDPDSFYDIVPSYLIQDRAPGASGAILAGALHGSGGMGALSAFSSELFTHNAQVAFLSFALGFALCLPSALGMMYNGANLGALMAVYAKAGLGIDFIGWISIHGVTELIAIALAGAAGLRIGRAFILPGQQERLVSLRQAGRNAGTVIVGTVIMLIVAGLLEGIGRQMIDSTPIRYAIGGATLFFWYSYLFRRPGPASTASTVTGATLTEGSAGR